MRIGLNATQAHVTIVDDGTGFDSNGHGGAGDSHFGLRFMRDRMQQIGGGSMKIDSKPGTGTVLTLNVPTRDHGGKTGESAVG